MNFLLIIKHLKNLLISLQNRHIFLLGETDIFYTFAVAAPKRAELEKRHFKLQTNSKNYKEVNL